jgi:hypothetical protein
VSILTQEFRSGPARLRIDVHSRARRQSVLGDVTFLNYRLAEVEIAADSLCSVPHIVWYEDEPTKDILWQGETLTLRGLWLVGELQQILVSMLALRMEAEGLHPFHASGIRYRDRTIMFLGGESNHGKTMSQIEGCRRGARVVSTETLVTDDRGWAVMGSREVFLRKRSEGTERSDLPDQDEGVAKFFDRIPELVHFEEQSNVDLVIVPSIDGNFAAKVVELGAFEREYQTFHSLMNYLGLHRMLAPKLAMPSLDTERRRQERADFCHRFAARPYFLIRAKDPHTLFGDLEPLIG